MNEFKINDFLTLKLEEGKTNIYVNGELFIHCKYLMLNIPVKKIQKFDKIDSIDEVADLLGWREEGQEGVEYEISSETEFWGHCSNLQTWYENNYDTRILHSNLSFPLLRRLFEIGDPLAKKRFKEEIVKRFESGYLTVIAYIFEQNLLNYLDKEERKDLIERGITTILANITSKLVGDNMGYAFSDMFGIAKEAGLIEDHFLALLETIKKLPDKHKYYAFSKLIESIKDTELLNRYYSQIETQYLVLLKTLDSQRDFSILVEIAKHTGLIEDHFLALLDVIYKLQDKNKLSVFSLLIDSIKDTELLNSYYSPIETQFLSLLDKINDFSDENKFNYGNFSDLIKVAGIMGWKEEHFLALLETIKKSDGEDKDSAFSMLLRITKNAGTIEEHFLAFLEFIGKLTNEIKYRSFYSLVDSIKSTEIFNKYNSQIEIVFLNILESIEILTGYETYYAFSYLLIIAKETGWIEKHFLVLFESVDKFTRLSKFDSFCDLFNLIKNSKLLSKYYSRIETQILSVLESIVFLPCSKFFALLEIVKGTGLIEKYFCVFFKVIEKLNDGDIYDAFSNLIDSIKNVEMFIKKHFLVFLKALNILENSEYDFNIHRYNNRRDHNSRDYDPSFQIYYKHRVYSYILKIAKESGLIDQYFPVFLNITTKYTGLAKYEAFSGLINLIKDTKLFTEYKSQIETQFLLLFESIQKLSEWEKHDGFYHLIESIKGTELFSIYYTQIETHFLVILRAIDKLSGEFKYRKFSGLIVAIKNTELFISYYSQIESQFLVFLENINKFDSWKKYKVFSHLINLIKDTELYTTYNSQIETQFLVFLKSIEKLSGRNKYNTFFRLIASIKVTKLFSIYYSQIETQFLDILKENDKLYISRGDIPYSDFLKIAKKTQFVKEHFLTVLKTLNKLDDSYDYDKDEFDWDCCYKYRAYSDLLKISKETGSISEYFPAFLEIIKEYTGPTKYYAFSGLIDSIKNTGLFTTYNSQIEAQFLTFLIPIEKLSGKNYWVNTRDFSLFIDSIKNTDLFTKYSSQVEIQFLALLEDIIKFDSWKKYKTFSLLIDSIKGTELFTKYYLQIEIQFLALFKSLNHRRFSEAIDSIKVEIMDKFYYLIEPQFLSLLKGIYKLSEEYKYGSFSFLIDSIKRSYLMEKYYSQIKTQFLSLWNGLNELKDQDLRDLAFQHLRGIIQRTSLKNESAYKKWEEDNPRY